VKRLSPWLVLALLMSCMFVSPASAALPNCAYFGNWHEGVWKDPKLNYVSNGTSAIVTVRSSALCGNQNSNNNIALAWTMIASNDGRGWAQAGFANYWGNPNGTVHFTQYKQGSCCSAVTYYGSQHLLSGQKYQYSERYIVNSYCLHSIGCLQGRVDNIIWFSTDFDPAGRWATPWLNEYEGETTYTGSDVPGLATSKTAFQSMQNQKADGTWEPQRCGMNDSHANPRWDHGLTGCDSRQVWTARLS